ncbi:MAG TPA: DUF444 family protein [Steroidobacteraceae bacterium]|nr:DUF444 family protein [Steroidobacteraceae bacterium]
MSTESTEEDQSAGAGAARPAINGWYELFSRGSRDWLRHGEKVREAVRDHLPQMVAGADIINHGARTVRVPVRLLEHYRFRLRAGGQALGVGQGDVKPGDLLGQPHNSDSGQGQKGAGGTERGGIELMLEFKVDDIIDWLWEELKLPNLQPRGGASEQADWQREGWDRHGARSRLDRRRSMREAAKRRVLGSAAPPLINDDLRYRQLTRRRQPSTRAAVFFLLDVSGSMTDRDRHLAKTFFFWVAAGLRREYRALDIVFVAHTTEAWEFSEADFFNVVGAGGTVASTGLAQVRQIAATRFAPAGCNLYLFYASDGDNAVDDRVEARRELAALADLTRYAGYVEIAPSNVRSVRTETMRMFDEAAAEGLPIGRFSIGSADDIAGAVRHFFSSEALDAETAAGGAP